MLQVWKAKDQVDQNGAVKEMEILKKYRVDTSTWSGQEMTDLQHALGLYELTKDREMSEGVNEDSYVELVCSEDDFEDYKVLKRAMVEIDNEKMAKGLPREKGFDFDYWAKWEEMIEGAIEIELRNA